MCPTSENYYANCNGLLESLVICRFERICCRTLSRMEMLLRAILACGVHIKKETSYEGSRLYFKVEVRIFESSRSTSPTPIVECMWRSLVRGNTVPGVGLSLSSGW
jgi:hypothetical protein